MRMRRFCLVKFYTQRRISHFKSRNAFITYLNEHNITTSTLVHLVKDTQRPRVENIF